MDFGSVELDGLVCCSSSVTPASNNGGLSFEIAAEGVDKHKGFGSGGLKLERAVNETTHCSGNLSEGHHQMLSFSSPSSQTGGGGLPYYHQTLSGFSRSTGLGSTGLSSSAGAFSGMRIPFTPSQWMELEHQALIYKYITSNVPIPSYLLNPIRKPLESAGFPTFSTLRSNPLGWGAFHLGVFSSSDPEPGRCRRTDGKKWRCSRDAVADQKYCERHMNRGRHRSRKPVEGQSGHAPTGTTTKPSPITSVASTGAAASSNTPSSLQPQHGSGIHGLSGFNRGLMDKENSSYSIQKQQNSFPEFGLVCSDSLINPLDQSSALHCRSFGVSDNISNKDNKTGSHSLRQFMDVWSESHSDRTQLSISIPMAAASDLMPSSPKLRRSSQELEMCLAVGTSNQRQATNWVPISWEPSMAGPLGEVLHNTSNVNGDSSLNSKPLNLMECFDIGSHLASSPTGVLSRGAFCSLSNSSAGSSPRAESCKTLDGGGTMNPSSLPNL